MSLPPFTFPPLYFFTQIYEPSILKGLSFDFEEQSLKDKDESPSETLLKPDNGPQLHYSSKPRCVF